jgi:hypothetical protein
MQREGPGIDSDRPRTVELARRAAHAADGAHVTPVSVPQHLYAMIVPVGNYDVASVVKRDANRTFKFPCPSAFTAYAAQKRTIAVAYDLQNMVRCSQHSALGFEQWNWSSWGLCLRVTGFMTCSLWFPPSATTTLCAASKTILPLPLSCPGSLPSLRDVRGLGLNKMAV